VARRLILLFAPLALVALLWAGCLVLDSALLPSTPADPLLEESIAIIGPYARLDDDLRQQEESLPLGS
jgi:hypothetical protein